MIKRDFYLNKLIRQRDRDIIKVVTGVRRSGKSVLLFDLYYNYLLDVGVASDHIIAINLENLENEQYRDGKKLYDYVLSKITDKKKFYVLIDEIQYIDGFEDVVNSIKNKGVDLYITGSNSKMLSGEINTALRGRSIEIRVYPLTFKEFYSYVQGDKRQAFNQFMLYGGFPYSVTEPEPQDKIDYLKMLEQTVSIKDIENRYGIKNKEAFYSVYDFLCSNIGALVSSKKISDTLKSNGHKTISVETVGNYLQYLCDAFLFTKVYRYDIKGREYLKTLNKYYMVDMGLRNAHINYRQVEPTHALENIVYLELVSRGFRVDIGKNKNKEIDFIASDASQTYYIQVAYSIMDEDKYNQEVSSFYNIDDGYKKIIITMDDDPFTLIERGYRKINAIDFLLDEDLLIKC